MWVVLFNMFGCEYCRQFPHDSRCLLAPKPKFSHHCSICGEGIYDGEEYVENDYGEFVHYDYLTIREMVEFLGYEVGIMGSEDDEDDRYSRT